MTECVRIQRRLLKAGDPDWTSWAAQCACTQFLPSTCPSPGAKPWGLLGCGQPNLRRKRPFDPPAERRENTLLRAQSCIPTAVKECSVHRNSRARHSIMSNGPCSCFMLFHGSWCSISSFSKSAGSLNTWTCRKASRSNPCWRRRFSGPVVKCFPQGHFAWGPHCIVNYDINCYVAEPVQKSDKAAHARD